MSKGFVCPQCGHNAWTVFRTHTLCETLTISNVDTDGMYTEDSNEFGDTIDTGEFGDITCAHCDSSAPANHPLWPEKEEPHV